MADNLCGPSNALKSFGDTLDHDRSLQQDRDRAAASGHGIQGFRSQAYQMNGNQEYQDFLNGGGPGIQEHMQTMGLPGPVNGHQLVHSPMSPGPVVNGNFPHGFHHDDIHVNGFHRGDVHINGFHPNAMHHSASAPALNGAHDWVSEFQAMGIADNSQHQDPGAVHGDFTEHGYPHVHTAGIDAVNGHFVPYISALPATHTGLVSGVNPIYNEECPVPGMTTAELDALFDEFEHANDGNEDFRHAMDDWMAEHGPTATDREDTTAIMESIAYEQEAQQAVDDAMRAVPGHSNIEARPVQEQAENAATETKTTAEHAADRQADELQKTAAEIIDALANNDSDKFKNSQFLNLMRRITAQEVRLKGADFVDVQTGTPVATVDYHDDKEKAASAADKGSSSSGAFADQQ